MNQSTRSLQKSPLPQDFQDEQDFSLLSLRLVGETGQARINPTRKHDLSGLVCLVQQCRKTDNINPILPLGIILPQRQTRINANGSILTHPYPPFLIDLRLPWR